jgi:hypothetical protein
LKSIRPRSRAQHSGEQSWLLKIELKPNERIIIGACMITNTDQRFRLHDTWHAEREEDVSGIPTRRPRAA